jgi:hypothetical protein
MRLTKPPVPVAAPVDVSAVQSALFNYELLMQQARKLREQHAQVFEQMDTLMAEADTVKDGIRRLVHRETNAPGDDLEEDKTYRVWARAQTYGVKTQYRRQASFFDARKIPPLVFAHNPQIVATVDTKLTQRVAKQDKRVLDAWTPGEWLTPSISVFATKGVTDE